VRLVLLRAGFVVLAVSALLATGRGAERSGRGAAAARDDLSERAYSVQLHLHGSFSEGEGSLDSHAFEARALGCDVLWWSDHDFRITTYQHVSRFGFEGWQEPLDRNEPWSTQLAKYLGDLKGLRIAALPEGASARLVQAPVREGRRSLRLSASADPNRAPLRLAFDAERRLHRRSLATGVRLGLALFPEELPEDATLRVEVQLSEHAPRAGLGLEPRFVRYEIGRVAGPPRRRGATYVVPVACEPGRWNELELELTRDAVRGFPESPGEDNALFHLFLELVPGARVATRVSLDDLRIEQRRAGAPLFARQRELMAEVAELHPGLVQLQGVEISYDSRHLNLFCAETPLPDYAALAAATPRDPENPAILDGRAFRARVLEWVIGETHARGGLVAYNHPFGVTSEGAGRPRTRAEQLAILLTNRAEGADLLEVGYRERGGASLDDHLWLWDQAALAGLRLVGTGTSDSHGGPDERWSGTPNNFVSWVYARSPDARSLIEGLRAGRVFFGDLERFDGTLDLALDSGERMGATVRSERRAFELELRATGTRRGQSVVLVESGVRTRTFAVEGADFVARCALALPPHGPAFVRMELHDEGRPIALSNPLHFVEKDGTPLEAGAKAR
jgi:hypothetical protein